MQRSNKRTSTKSLEFSGYLLPSTSENQRSKVPKHLSVWMVEGLSKAKANSAGDQQDLVGKYDIGMVMWSEVVHRLLAQITWVIEC